MEQYVKENEKIINSWCKDGWEWSIPVSHEKYLEALQGTYEIFLTPTKPIPHTWLNHIKGKNVLALASGGGQQAPLLTALGANVTVLDFSTEQIQKEYEIKKREGYEITIIQADMTQPLPFSDESFDFIIHPVSNVYVEHVYPIWKECYRILKSNGYLISGLDNGMNYIVDNEEKEIIRSLPFNPLLNDEHKKFCIEENSGFQFSHSIEEQINGQLQCGFQLLEIFSDTNGYGRLHELNIPSYWCTYSQKLK